MLPYPHATLTEYARKSAYTPFFECTKLVVPLSTLWRSHTYLAQETLWSCWQFSQGEALPLHFGLADPCDNPKCGLLGSAIFVSGGLRSRYPLIIQRINSQLPFLYLAGAGIMKPLRLTKAWLSD